MKIFKKGTALLLCMAMMLSMLPLQIAAQEATVTVSCTAGYMDSGEFVENSDTVSAEGVGLTDICAIWTEDYDQILLSLYGKEGYYSPYEITVGGYTQGDPLVITFTVDAEMNPKEGLRVYDLQDASDPQRITELTVTDVELDGYPCLSIAFTTDHTGVFAFGNIDESIPDDSEETEPETTEPETTEPETTEPETTEPEETEPETTEPETTEPETTEPEETEPETTEPAETEPSLHSWSDDSVTIYAAAVGLTALSAEIYSDSALEDVFTDFVSYTLSPAGHTEGDVIYYGIELPESYDFDNLALYGIADGELTALEYDLAGNFVTFEATGALTFACGVLAVPAGWPLTDLELEGDLPTDCFVDEQIDMSGIRVLAVYEQNGEEFRYVLHQVESIQENGYMVIADTSEPGEITVYVTYGTAMDTFKVQVHQAQFADPDTGVSIQVGEFGTTSVTVEVLDNAAFAESALTDFLSNFVAYNIELEGYTQGDYATVTLPIPEGVAHPAVFYVSENGADVVMHPCTDNGDGTVSFKTNHFSTYAVGEEGISGETISDTTTISGTTLNEITVTVPNTVKYVWKKVDTITSGKTYLIVNSATTGNAHALTNNDGSIADTAVVITGTTDNLYIEVTDDNKDIGWKSTGSNNVFAFSNDSYYLAWTDTSSSGSWGSTNHSYSLALSTISYEWTTDTNAASALTNLITVDSLIDYFDEYTDFYLSYQDDKWAMTTTVSSVYFYEYTQTSSRQEATYGIDILLDGAATQAHTVKTYTDPFTLSAELTTTVDGQLPSGGTYSWEKVTNNGVATVDENGNVSFTGTAGKEAIKVTYSWTEGSTACSVSNYIVITAEAPVYTLVITSPENTTYKTHADVDATAVIQRDGVEYTSDGITWVSGNEDIVTVEDGKLNIKAAGTTTLTATAANPGNSSETLQAGVTVTFTNPVYSLSVTEPEDNSTVKTGATVQAVAVVTADSDVIEGAQIIWTSSNPAIATVDANGVITGVAASEEAVTITATYTDPLNVEHKVEKTIYVADAVYEVTLSPETATVVLGQSVTLTPELYDGDTKIEDATFTWEYSEPGIVEVNENGIAVGRGAGTVSVTAVYKDANGRVFKSATACEITVTAAEYALNLYEVDVTVDDNGNVISVTQGEEITKPLIQKNVSQGDTYSIWAVITADGTDIGQLDEAQLAYLTWTSSNSAIATIDSKTGIITFQGGEGTVSISAYYEYADGRSVMDTVVISVSTDGNYVPEDGTDDFPEYPDEGSIRFDKTATAVGNFSDTGIAKVELSMTGVPYTEGSEIDVVVMLDMTGSMSSNGMIAAEEATVAFVEKIVKNEDGTYNKNRVAVYAFNSGSSSPYELVSLGTISSDTELETANTAIRTASTKQASGGTPFDEATATCKKVLDAAKTDGTGNDRKQFCVFMSDGGPTTFEGSDGYTYYGGNSSGDRKITSYIGGYSSSTSSDWTYNLPSELYTDQMKAAGVTVYTVGLLLQTAPSNPEPYSSMTDSTYDSTTDTLTTVGSHYFFTSTILKSMATDSTKYIDIFNVDNADKATEAFTNIAMSIRQAATNVKVEDEISPYFTMVFEPPNATVSANAGNQEYYIEVTEYALNAVTDSEGKVTDYTRGTGTSKLKLYMGTETDSAGVMTYYAASDASGTAYDSPTFANQPLGTEGTMYYWTTTDISGEEDYSGVSVTVSDTVYYFDPDGKNSNDSDWSSVSSVWFNMTSGAYASGTVTDTVIDNRDGTDEHNHESHDLIIATPYFVYNAATKMLVWTLDKLGNTEMTLSYFLFLDNSAGYENDPSLMASGTYETNVKAELTYENFQHTDCEVEMPVPKITWHGAQVSYVFYLVNEKGQPVNRAGRVVPLSEAVYVTDVHTESITWMDTMLNGLEADKLADDLLPDVYELFDPGATYRIHVYDDAKSNHLTNHFVITSDLTKRADYSDIQSSITNQYTTYVFNKKSDVKWYNEPGAYISYDETGTTYTCKGDGTITEKDGAYSYTSASGETQHVFTDSVSSTSTNFVYEEAITGGYYTYFKDDDDSIYTIVDKPTDKKTEAGFDYANTTVAFAVVWKPELVPDTVVIDFGLDLEVNVIENDAMAAGLTGLLTEAVDNATINTGTYQQSHGQQSITLKNSDGTEVATAFVANQNNIRFVFDPNNAMKFNDAITFYYETQVNLYSTEQTQDEGELNTTFMYSSLTVIPATTIYYEDEYVQLSSQTKGDSGWTTDTDSGWTASVAASATQSVDRPGASKISQLYDGDNLYGSDPAYESCSTYSMENAAEITVDATHRGEASFEFWGTGFDVIGVTSNKTGVIFVQLYPWDSNAGAFSSDPLFNYMVDTYYGYTRKEITFTYTNGKWSSPDVTDESDQFTVSFPEDPEEGATVNGYLWTAETGEENALYQIPVMKISGQTYGRYKAVIQVRYSPAFDHASNSNATFWLDAIRIYDPAGTTPSDTVTDAYVADGEAWPLYEEVRNWILSAGTFDSLNSDSVSGIVFIDADGNTSSVVDYRNFGPNNEVYLATGQSIAFTVNGGNAKSVQIGLKRVGSETNTKDNVQIWSVSTDGTLSPTEKLSVNTATDMFYDITSHNQKTVVIQNDGDSILSVTNVKFTYGAQADRPSEAAAASLFTVSRAAIQAVLALMNAPDSPEPTVPEETVPEPTLPEETVPEETEPDVTEPTAPTPTEPKPSKPSSGTSGGTTQETQPEDTEPAETEPVTEATVPDAETEAATEPSEAPEQVEEVTAPEVGADEPESVLSAPAEPEAEEKMSVWEMLLDILASFFRFILGIFRGWK